MREREREGMGEGEIASLNSHSSLAEYARISIYLVYLVYLSRSNLILVLNIPCNLEKGGCGRVIIGLAESRDVLVIIKYI